MTYYKQSLDSFLSTCGDMTEEEREKATAAFDDTLIAAQARFADGWHEMGVAIFDAMPSLRQSP